MFLLRLSSTMTPDLVQLTWFLFAALPMTFMSDDALFVFRKAIRRIGDRLRRHEYAFPQDVPRNRMRRMIGGLRISWVLFWRALLRAAG
jgi:hypothetical protein